MITNLYTKIAYPENQTDLPILVSMHGWDSDTIADDYMARLAGLGFFVLGVSMRGRSCSLGTKDCFGREVHDVMDAVKKVRTLYSSIVSDKLIIKGDSGGGGIAFAFACKFPDAATLIVSDFGISDPGYDTTYGWVYQNTGYANKVYQQMELKTVYTDPYRYQTRDATQFITNFTGGTLVMVHDAGDITVRISQSERVRDAMIAAGMSNYITLFSSSSDAVRYVHGMDVNGAAELQAEQTWVPLAKSLTPWSVPEIGTRKIPGYVCTKRFEIWIDKGLTVPATVDYDTTTGTYTINPWKTGTFNVIIKQGARSITQTITGQTTITLP